MATGVKKRKKISRNSVQVGATLMHADGQRDKKTDWMQVGQHEANRTSFATYENAPKKV